MKDRGVSELVRVRFPRRPMAARSRDRRDPQTSISRPRRAANHLKSFQQFVIIIRRMKTNPTIARLDRHASVIGVELRKIGQRVNAREFDFHGRVIQYQPGGLGVVRLRSYVDGQLDSESVATIGRVLELFQRAKETSR